MNFEGKNEIHLPLLNGLNYLKMVEKVENKIQSFKKDFEILNLLNEQTTKNEHERKKFYSELNKKVLLIKRFQNLHQHVINCPNLKNFDSEIAKILIEKRQDIINRLDFILRKGTLTDDDCKNFNVYYQNLISLKEEIHLKDFSNETVIDGVRLRFYQIVDEIKYKIEDADVEKASKYLVLIKTVSDNMLLFKKEIDNNFKF